MARRRRSEEPVNHDRWLVSYADFITILFAFFVVMYSISSVSEGKYRVLSDSLVSAFNNSDSSRESVQVIHVEDSAEVTAGPTSDARELLEPVSLSPQMENQQDEERKQSDESFSQKVLDAAETEIDGLAGHVEDQMGSLIDTGIINVKRNKFWLEVEIKSSLLFPSGGSSLIPASIPILIDLSDIFADLPNRIHIEGFTDNLPISTQVFPSNWELSSARASAVVRLFESNGVEPSRMASIGYGEYHPVSDNTSEEGRAKNRRVVVVVMASLEGQKDERIYEFELSKEKTVASTDTQ